eukprot:COSAG06_NODE_38927_length_418_cov_0.648903_1_plen_59_part_10
MPCAEPTLRRRMVASRLALSLLAAAAQVAQAQAQAQVAAAPASGFPPAAVGAWTWTGLP